MSNDNDPRPALYKEMTDLTHEDCSKCVRPFSCCDEMYCAIAVQWAKSEYGVELTPVPEEDRVHDHYSTKSLPPFNLYPFLLSKTGCTAKPEHRPMCTMHTCTMASRGYLANDLDGTRTKTYHALRKKIDDAENARWLTKTE